MTLIVCVLSARKTLLQRVVSAVVMGVVKTAHASAIQVGLFLHLNVFNYKII